MPRGHSIRVKSVDFDTILEGETRKRGGQINVRLRVIRGSQAVGIMWNTCRPVCSCQQGRIQVPRSTSVRAGDTAAAVQQSSAKCSLACNLVVSTYLLELGPCEDSFDKFTLSNFLEKSRAEQRLRPELATSSVKSLFGLGIKGWIHNQTIHEYLRIKNNDKMAQIRTTSDRWD